MSQVGVPLPLTKINKQAKHTYATVATIIVTIGSSGSDTFPEQTKLVSGHEYKSDNYRD